MIAAIRQSVTVQAEGTVEVHAPELRAGARAEVIVLVDEADCRVDGPQLEALDVLQASLKLTSSSAGEWVRLARSEREAFGMRQ